MNETHFYSDENVNEKWTFVFGYGSMNKDNKLDLF